MKAFILAETQSAARELCSGARKQADEVILISIGIAPFSGISDRVVHIEVPQNSLIEDAYSTVIELFDAEKPDFVFIEPTRRMKALAGRVAAHLNTSVITDVLRLEDGAAWSRYYGGVGERSYKVKSGIVMMSVVPGVFDASEASGVGIVEEVSYVAPRVAGVRIASKALPESGGNLLNADVVVCAGRGFAEKADLELANTLAGKTKGEVACTRPLTEGVDWMPKGSYIGVSGLSLSPNVYLAIGVSGQMQHMVGCNHSGTIFAVNKDKNAPIFKQSDYGLVGDLKTVLPLLIEAL